MLFRFACPKCGRHISATRDQIGITVRCPNCNAPVAVPKTSTLPPPAPGPLIRFACASCGQHLSATRAQIGLTAPCPNCKEAVIVPTTSTLPPVRPVPLLRPVQTKFQEKKRYETTVILIDDSVALLDNRKKLRKWTNDFTEARNWLVGELDALHGEQYVAGIFDHQQNRSVLKMNRA